VSKINNFDTWHNYEVTRVKNLKSSKKLEIDTRR